MLYYIMLYYNLLHYSMLYDKLLLYYIVSYCMVWYCIVLYCIVLLHYGWRSRKPSAGFVMYANMYPWSIPSLGSFLRVLSSELLASLVQSIIKYS